MVKISLTNPEEMLNCIPIVTDDIWINTDHAELSFIIII